MSVLESAVPVAARVAGFLASFSVVVLVATAIVVVILAAVIRPVTVGSLIPFAVFVVLLAVPGLVLRLFHGALEELLEMPEYLRSSPEVARTHGHELSRLAGQASARARDRVTAIPRDLFRAGRLLMRAHGDLPEYGRLVRLVNVPFLVVALVSFLAGFAVVALALVLAVVGPLLIWLR